MARRSDAIGGAAWLAAMALVSSVLGGAGALAAAAQVTFRSGIDVVHFWVTVVDRKGSLVTELTADDFVVVEEGREQSIRHFAGGSRDSEVRLHLGLLMDTSGSMQEDLRFSQSAAIKFLNRLSDAVDITLVDFDTEVRVARYGQVDFARLIERIRRRKADGWTALYDALGVYLDGASDQDGRKILVLYTDGGDTRSIITFADALTLVRASDVTVYAIGLLEHQSSTVRNEQRLRLQQLAETTGGLAYFPMSLEALDGIYDKVLADITGQYVLGYVSTDPRTEGAWRRVEIRLKRPELRDYRVRTRRGYFAPYRTDKPSGAPKPQVQPGA